MTVWKKYGLLALAGLVLFAAGGATARFALPARVEYVKETVEVHHKAQVLDTDALMKQLAKTLQEQSEKRNIKKTVKTTKAPDGSETREEVFVDLSETNLKIESSIETLTSLKSQLKLLEESLKLSRETKVVINQAKNKFGVLVGYDFRSLFGHHEGWNLLKVRGLVAGLQYERRLLGPFWGTMWAQTNGTAGVGAKLEF